MPKPALSWTEEHVLWRGKSRWEGWLVSASAFANIHMYMIRTTDYLWIYVCIWYELRIRPSRTRSPEVKMTWVLNELPQSIIRIISVRTNRFTFRDKPTCEVNDRETISNINSWCAIQRKVERTQITCSRIQLQCICVLVAPQSRHFQVFHRI